MSDIRYPSGMAFVNGCLYHVFNRGVDKRKIFLEEKDYHRFIFGMNEFNDENSAINILRRLNANEGNPISFKPGNKKPLVEVLSYCLMPNHFHFLIKQLRHHGISKFMQKLGIGYTNYFNQKYERSGVLFQGKFKKVLVEKDNYLNYLKQYIHLNPLDIIVPLWKEKGIGNLKAAREFLEHYKWTSRGKQGNYEDMLRNFDPGIFSKIKELNLTLDY